MFCVSVSYRKGGAILRMLKTILGDGGFKTGILYFLQKFQFSSATSSDLWNSFEQWRNTTEVCYIAIRQLLVTWHNIAQSEVPFPNQDMFQICFLFPKKIYSQTEWMSPVDHPSGNLLRSSFGQSSVRDKTQSKILLIMLWPRAGT